MPVPPKQRMLQKLVPLLSFRAMGGPFVFGLDTSAISLPP